MQENSQVVVRLHKGSDLNPVLFIIIMDVIAENIATTPSREMMLADDLVLCEETTEETDQQLEVRRNAVENRGMSVSRQKNRILGTFVVRVQTKPGQPGAANSHQNKMPVLGLRCGRYH